MEVDRKEVHGSPDTITPEILENITTLSQKYELACMDHQSFLDSTHRP